MRKIQLLLLMAVCTLSAVAQEDGNYYRVQNTKSSRFISVKDNRGSINLNTTSADLDALKTVKGDYFHYSDPSTIIKFEKMSSNGWNLMSQGTDTYSIISYQVKIKFDSRYNSYLAYAENSTGARYLADSYEIGEDEPFGELYPVAPANDKSYWNLLPLSTTGDNYFGLEPTISAGGSYYQTFYAGFPFTFYLSGMEAYYVKTIDNAKAAVVIEPISGGVAAETPVLIKCASNQATNNRLNIGSGSGSASDNKLTGVYFCNDITSIKHRNVVEYAPTTMRVLGTASDGSLAFVKSSDLQYIPANTAYITVAADAPDELKVYTQSEYDALPSAMRGDLNDDGKVSGLDLVVMANMILGVREKTTAADLNKDGKVSGLDYVILVNIILKQ